MSPTPDVFIDRAPHDVAGWVRLIDPASLPVLHRTAMALDELRPAEDEVDAHMLTEVVANDPLMTLKLLAHVAGMRRFLEGAGAETVTQALVMMGIPPFFNIFSEQATVEERLMEWPDALAGFQEVLRRSRRAARFAIGFAVHRMDPDAQVIHEAALLHDFAELLLWYRAPALALEIARRQEAEPTLRSRAVQHEVLHVELGELQQALLSAWRLPTLLVQISSEHLHEQCSVNTQMRNVQLAIRVARHSAQGWDNPALPDDLHEIGHLLQLGPEPTKRLLLEIDAEGD